MNPLGGFEAVNLFKSSSKSFVLPFTLSWLSHEATSCIAINFYNMRHYGIFLRFSNSAISEELTEADEEFFGEIWGTTNWGSHSPNVYSPFSYNKTLKNLEWDDCTFDYIVATAPADYLYTNNYVGVSGEQSALVAGTSISVSYSGGGLLRRGMFIETPSPLKTLLVAIVCDEQAGMENPFNADYDSITIEEILLV